MFFINYIFPRKPILCDLALRLAHILKFPNKFRVSMESYVGILDIIKVQFLCKYIHNIGWAIAIFVYPFSCLYNGTFYTKTDQYGT